MRVEIINDRLSRLRALMGRQLIDVFVLLVHESSNSESCRYISGFTGSSAALLIDNKRSVLISDGRYKSQASEQSPFEFVLSPKNPMIEIQKLASEAKYQKLGFEGDKISYSVYKNFLSQLPIKLDDVSNIVPALRRKKGPEEVSSIARAGKIALESYAEALKEVRLGMTEAEFSNLLLNFIKFNGGEAGWTRSDFVVASGARSSLPHGRATDKEFEKGDIVTVDFGATVDGYMCDITRNFSMGKPSERALRVHDLLVDASENAVRLLGPQRACAEVDAAARKIIERGGYGQYFTHGLGHGLGLEVHEAPRLSPSSNESLVVGDVVTIEPGVYIEGWGGMRVENDYVITNEGALCLTRNESREELKVIDMGYA